MDKIKNIGTKYGKYFKIFFVILMCVLSIVAIRNELQDVNREDINNLVDSIGVAKIFGLLVVGSIAFSFSTSYDLVLAKYYNIELKAKDIFQIGWIAQSFNYFLGLAGMTGYTIRSKMYESEKVPPKTASKIALMIALNGIIGLFYLAAPAIGGLMEIGQVQYIPIMLAAFALGLLYLFIHKLPVKIFKSEKFMARLPEFNLRYKLVLTSILEWLIAAVYFYIVMHEFLQQIALMEAIMIYVLATIVGLLSMIPGGLGSFEGAVLIFLGSRGYESANITLALLLFRAGYTVIPWILGIFLLGIRNIHNKKLAMGDLQYYRLINRIMGVLVFISGAVLVLSSSTPEIFDRVRILHLLFPKIVPIVSTWITFSFGILLVILSKGIFNGVKRTHHFAIAVLVLASLTCMIKGLDHEEAILMLVTAFALFMNREAFQNSSIQITASSFLKVLLTSLALIAGYFIVYNISHRIDFLKGTERYSLSFMKSNGNFMLSFLALTVAVGVALTFTARRYLAFSDIKAEDIKAYEEIRDAYENSAYTHLFYMKDKNIFFNSKKTVVFLYRSYKHNIFVLGDPVGERWDFEDAIDELIVWAHEKNMVVSFYEITGKYIEDFVNSGFRFLKIGESAGVDLKKFTTEGKQGKGFRQILNKMTENALSFKVYNPPYDEKLMEELEVISKDWLQGRGEMGYSIGSFNPDYLARARIFAIEDKDNKIQAFANEMIIKNTKILSIDLMRHRSEALNGMMDMLFISMMLWGKGEGYEVFDMGIAPLSNVGNKLYSDAKEKLIHLAYQYGNKIYGFVGLRNYKQKFHPNWSNVYIAYKESRMLPEILLDLSLVCHNKEESY